jgi:hypothetical protein
MIRKLLLAVEYTSGSGSTESLMGSANSTPRMVHFTMGSGKQEKNQASAGFSPIMATSLMASGRMIRR